jgi:hypothetical protein
LPCCIATYTFRIETTGREPTCPAQAYEVRRMILKHDPMGGSGDMAEGRNLYGPTIGHVGGQP